jgi:hypothetical protein
MRVQPDTTVVTGKVGTDQGGEKFPRVVGNLNSFVPVLYDGAVGSRRDWEECGP